jgi:hypothetical protein
MCPAPPVLHQRLHQAVPSYVATFSVETCRSVTALCAEAILWVLDHPRAQQGSVFELGQTFGAMFHNLVDAPLTYPPNGPLQPRSTGGPGDS